MSRSTKRYWCSKKRNWVVKPVKDCRCKMCQIVRHVKHSTNKKARQTSFEGED